MEKEMAIDVLCERERELNALQRLGWVHTTAMLNIGSPDSDSIFVFSHPLRFSRS